MGASELPVWSPSRLNSFLRALSRFLSPYYLGFVTLCVGGCFFPSTFCSCRTKIVPANRCLSDVFRAFLGVFRGRFRGRFVRFWGRFRGLLCVFLPSRPLSGPFLRLPFLFSNYLCICNISVVGQKSHLFNLQFIESLLVILGIFL